MGQDRNKIYHVNPNAGDNYVDIKGNDIYINYQYTKKSNGVNVEPTVEKGVRAQEFKHGYQIQEGKLYIIDATGHKNNSLSLELETYNRAYSLEGTGYMSLEVNGAIIKILNKNQLTIELVKNITETDKTLINSEPKYLYKDLPVINNTKPFGTTK